MTDRTPGFATRSVHAGDDPDPATGARAVPIYQTSSFVFDDADHAAALYGLEADDDIYTRISNPTVRTLEERLAALEGGAGAVATGSGMAALDALTFLLAAPGDNVVSAAAIYGGTHAYLAHTAGRRDVAARFVDTLDPEAYADAIDDDTAFVHCETIGNPALVTPDLEAVAEVAHDRDVPLVVDNTFATPALCRPLDHGADVVWESTTKWLEGGGTTIGGVVVDGGSFDWAGGGYPEVAGPSPAYPDVNFTRDFPEAPLAAALRFRAVRSLGDGQSPFDAWVTLQGVETLSLRMDRHCESALAVAEFLAGHDDVAWVAYPGLPDHETHEAATRYLAGGGSDGDGEGGAGGGDGRDGRGDDAAGDDTAPDGTAVDGYGGMIAFGLDGGHEAGRRLCEATELASFLGNVGDAKTLVIHPASTTHAQLSEADQRASGVTPDLVRLSVGLEDPEDVVADLRRAIDVAMADG